MTRARLIALGTLALIIAAVCIRLGFWQLDRLAERRAENARVIAGLAGTPVAIEALSADSSQSRAQRVEVRGSYDFANEVALINRSRDGAPGVNILTPLRLPGRDTAIIVNRGWVYSPDGATVDLQRWREAADARGTAYISWLGTSTPEATASQPNPEIAAASANRDVTGDTATRRLVRLQRDAIAQLMPYPIAPYQLVLIEEANQPDSAGFSVEGGAPAPFGTAVVDPTRPVRIPLPAIDEGPHKSYALQWFAFAAIALIGTAAVVRSEWSSAV